MYSTCLFCSASLGTNEAMETFPVGERVAFDPHRGRLWAACGRCGRWNLAPIEERWEAVEQGERLFRDTRTRVHSGNIGLARLRDGTRLIRVGAALPGELAAWRYGAQLISRRRRNFAIAGAAVAGGVALAAGAPFLAMAGAPVTVFSAAFNIGNLYNIRRQRLRVVHRLSAHDSPTERELIIRRWHLFDARMALGDDGSLVVDMPPVTHDKPAARLRRQPSPEATFRLQGPAAQMLIQKMMLDYNQNGATQKDVDKALQAIADAGGPAEFTQRVAAPGLALVHPNAYGRHYPGVVYTPRMILGTFRNEKLPVVRYRSPFQAGTRPMASRIEALALEMALQEEAERRALEGELAALEAAWREAEEIAHIADALPD